MHLIPAYWVALITGIAGMSWILFARSQKGRYQASVLPWLSIPFFALCFIYTWFAFNEVSIEIRAVYARLGIMSIALPQAIILMVLYFFNGGRYGKLD